MKITLLALAMTMAPGVIWAAGGDETAPPTPTETSTTCKKGKVWDDKTKSCVNPAHASIDDDARFDAVRELAYADRPADAQAVLATMTNQTEDRVQTYWAFTWRKLGRGDLAMAHYDRALATNPDNILARSYFGQALALAGQRDAALAQLVEIRARGGAGTWAEASLDATIRTGRAENY